MEKQNLQIRLERPDDHRAVESMVRESFWNVYRPGCMEHYLLHQLRNDPDFVRKLDFVMEKDGQLIGQNMFMRAVIQADDGRQIPILTMGPICTAPDFKPQGYFVEDADVEAFDETFPPKNQAKMARPARELIAHR